MRSQPLPEFLHNPKDTWMPVKLSLGAADFYSVALLYLVDACFSDSMRDDLDWGLLG
ncbi:MULTISPECIES: hypothetical protein [Moorena]|uniref:hypothetical protein n=1 Tax=Moorena TaxID=1155738 RepID=UPI0012B655C1|nr:MULTISPECIES: hypothetical protein [Moorena]NEP31962.1 hypothetical protein [Moorena sp. SIO3B2]NEP68811.1 hypothetical protein [Moorena sp. SIO3A5]NER86609.1 hypothetical protein [Moorena sp. SIO3A2]